MIEILTSTKPKGICNVFFLAKLTAVFFVRVFLEKKTTQKHAIILSQIIQLSLVVAFKVTNADSHLFLINADSNSFSQCSWLRSDYKEPDGSAMEEKVLHRAYGHSSRRQQILAATVAKKVRLALFFAVAVHGVLKRKVCSLRMEHQS